MAFNKPQEEVREYDKKHGWDNDNSSHIVLHMAEETGEIARNILRAENYKHEKFDKKNLAEEITDLLYLTLKLANKSEIDVDTEWNLMWGRYKSKTNRL
jgi:NTP pyrophosphatase (non-canonical NTP hydrolase)